MKENIVLDAMHHFEFYCTIVIIFGNLAVTTSEADIKNSKINCKMKDFGSSTENITCEKRELNANIALLENGDAFIELINTTLPSSEFCILNRHFFICVDVWEIIQKNILHRCDKVFYEVQEYEILANGSILLYGDILENGTYKFDDDGIITCAMDYDFSIHNFSANHRFPYKESDYNWLSNYFVKIGVCISILALLSHLVIFCIIPSLRNLPSYNLFSLSIALLLAYSISLIAQIRDIVGVYCVIVAVLQKYFFLASFFWMNVIAFDMWRRMRTLTRINSAITSNFRRKRFLFYSLYAWSVPLAISLTSVMIDNIENVPQAYKPHFGFDDICWIVVNLAQIIFFSVPAFTLVTMNSIFFVLTAFLINSNAMKNSNDQQVNAERINFFLYLKLGSLMGITWMVGVFATVSYNNVIWDIFEVLNSFQGLFLFLIFAVSKKVNKHFRKRSK